MFSQNQLLFLCAFLAVTGTLAFALLASRLQPLQLKPSEVTAGNSGALAMVSGRPSGVSLKAAGLSLLLCDGGCVSVRATRQVGEELEQNGVLQKLKASNWASATGVVKNSGESAYLQMLEGNSLEVSG